MESRRASLVIAFITWIIARSVALAHNPDTSYATVEISEERVELKFTYDLSALSKIVKLDDDNDGRVARGELQRHLPELEKFLSKHIDLEIPSEPRSLGASQGFVWPRDVGEEIAEKDFHSAGSLISFRFLKQCTDMPEDVSLTFRFFAVLGQRHSVLARFIHEGKDTEVVFNQFEPEFLFDTGHQTSVWRRLLKFCRLGIEHVLLGFDHLCFLAALVVVGSFRDLLKIITAFTIAHSVTLCLAALHVVSLPTRLVEAAIAVTIIYVAVENIVCRPSGWRWALAGVFGLVHGFGYAAALETLGMPAEGLIRCLLAFNVGVEAGQLSVMICLLPMIAAMQRSVHREWVMKGFSTALAMVGCAWFVDRLFDRGWIQF
jgi:hydrogenase/urease accessory protein HupE